jgi:hypothetical protein
MSEADVDQNEARQTSGSDNDVFSTSFISKMHPNFRSPVPVPEAETGIVAETGIESDASFEPPDAGTGSSTPLEAPTPEIAEPQPAINLQGVAS